MLAEITPRTLDRIREEQTNERAWNVRDTVRAFTEQHPALMSPCAEVQRQAENDVISVLAREMLSRESTDSETREALAEVLRLSE
jgi:hypothetical protein